MFVTLDLIIGPSSLLQLKKKQQKTQASEIKLKVRNLLM